jgi:lincosamide nucleotidyltransferase A/C/D/E
LRPEPQASWHLMTATSALQLLDSLTAHGVNACVGGGWAVDALLGRQTREHSDLDLWVVASDVKSSFVALAECGVDRVLPWPGDRPWNFVLHDGAELRVDLHFWEPLPGGRWHYGGIASDEVYPAVALDGRGTIAGRRVRCEDAEYSVRWHSGYPPRDVDQHDVRLLCAEFGIDLPDVFRGERA